MLHDIIVIVAGLAGSCAAQRLNRLGYDVVVVEKNFSFSDD
jgi:flavin-dependent dehydrogenase